MRTMTLIILAAVAISGCQQVDENPKWNPRAEMPPWTYDAPLYYRPSEDLPITETVGDGIPVYYTNQNGFFIRHPGGCQLNGVPRVAVWDSNDEGTNWQRSGYFGVEQTHFLFRAEADGRYWIRFVGPGQGVTQCPPGMPHRIYIVDRMPPTIELSVDPPPWMDKEKKTPRIYKPGQAVTIYWGVSDAYLTPGTIRLGTCFAGFPSNLTWASVPHALAESDSLTIEMPADAAKYGGIRFRVEATDKAGNIGVAMTDVLMVEGEKMPASKPVTTAAAGEKVVTRLDVGSSKPGWPVHGDKLQGGQGRELNWLPKNAENYEKLELQFSSNDGLKWTTVATGVKSGQTTRWIVPNVTSSDCRIRVAAVTETKQTGERLDVPLAISQRFETKASAAETASKSATQPAQK